ncbi:hypothetical protein L1887_63384 [Cichorium endivia]|nr:hypothetical protein L1887_63384 [Cichorium endivia]
MGGGAWPFLVGGAICLVNSVNERDLSLLTSYVEVSLHGQLLRGTMAFQATEIIAIVGLQRGIPSKRESSARVDYVPALCTHRPSLLPIEWSGEVLGSRRREPAEGSLSNPAKQERPREHVPNNRESGVRAFALSLAPRRLMFVNPVNHRVFERKLRPKPSGRGHACLGVTHRVAPNHASLIGTHGIGAEIGLPCLWCGWPKLESPSVDARLVVVEKTLVLCRAS